jgi:hypothetical protein
MTNKKQKTIVKEFLSADEDSSTIGSKYKDMFLDKRQEFINKMMGNKKELVKRYGKNAEQVIVGKAVKDAKNYIKKMEQQDLKELVRKSLMQEESPKGWDATKDTPEIKALMAIADDTSKSYLERDNARQKAYDLRSKLSKEEVKEDIDLGHEDNEPHMIKGELYQIGKYAMELYSMLEKYDEMNQEVDFPAWWQSKITTAKNMMSGVKHYLEFEINEPKIDAAVDALTDKESHEDESEVYMVGEKKAKEDYDGDGKIESSEEEYKGSRDKAIKKAKGLAEIIASKLKEERFKKGTDIGKKGPGFEKIEKSAEKKYGSEEAGKRVAGAILKKVLAKKGK